MVVWRAALAVMAIGACLVLSRPAEHDSHCRGISLLGLVGS